ncbi:MAG TPA: hypothetical protein VK003_09790 [Oceanobacillus sp.]|nr:hypothetical protein [Oceanobacillus sp.]
MLAPRCDLNKPGVKRLNQAGGFSLIANRKLYESGKSQRFAVVRPGARCVDSVHEDYDEAISYIQTLM